MRHTEFWQRMDEALGSSYAKSWAELHVIQELGGRTASEALNSGESPKVVWRAVWSALHLPDRER